MFRRREATHNDGKGGHNNKSGRTKIPTSIITANRASAPSIFSPRLLRHPRKKKERKKNRKKRVKRDLLLLKHSILISHLNASSSMQALSFDALGFSQVFNVPYRVFIPPGYLAFIITIHLQDQNVVTPRQRFPNSPSNISDQYDWRKHDR